MTVRFSGPEGCVRSHITVCHRRSAAWNNVAPQMTKHPGVVFQGTAISYSEDFIRFFFFFEKHFSAFVQEFPVQCWKYDRFACPSKLLSLRKQDLVPPLVILLPCWSVVIAASEAGVSTKTRVREGSVLVNIAGFFESASSRPCTIHVTVEPSSIGYKCF